MARYARLTPDDPLAVWAPLGASCSRCSCGSAWRTCAKAARMGCANPCCPQAAVAPGDIKTAGRVAARHARALPCLPKAVN
eukprot:352421-Chlamydomonas_euryale.AAC.58